ncbi:hypothetical protein C2G38_2185598 [Gigaspora rosea]|uniref:Serine-threonine/tyrosine-protein kinase catalytic domain-containing protein n=1 Tax=Gigaspora rosea TaxID=44941 RepID=A0A397V9T7_9GLOM|nr:hypothetical protein C2G38_2185598 [Gigaspora rosea]
MCGLKKKENNLSTNEITFLHSFRLIGDTEESLIEDKKEKLNLINEKDLINVEYLAKRGFAIVYSVAWRTGSNNEFDMIKYQFKRASSEEYGYVPSIMYLLGFGYATFKNDPNDASLILKIIDGERPQIKGVPEFYKNLMISCWDNDPDNRQQ